MPIYLVQDHDRPMWVRANTFGHADTKWREHIATENETTFEDVEPPQGIQFICNDEDFIE